VSCKSGKSKVKKGEDRHKTSLDKARRAYDLYEKGMTITGIAEEMGLSRPTIRYYKKRDKWISPKQLQDLRVTELAGQRLKEWKAGLIAKWARSIEILSDKFLEGIIKMVSDMNMPEIDIVSMSRWVYSMRLLTGMIRELHDDEKRFIVTEEVIDRIACDFIRVIGDDEVMGHIFKERIKIIKERLVGTNERAD